MTRDFAAVPRLTLGKRTALSVVSPLVTGVSSLLRSLGSHFTRDSGRILLTEVSRMSEALYTWVLKTGSEANAVEAKVRLKRLRKQLCKLNWLADDYQSTVGNDCYGMFIMYQGVVMRQSFRGALSSPYSGFCDRT